MEENKDKPIEVIRDTGLGADLAAVMAKHGMHTMVFAAMDNKDHDAADGNFHVGAVGCMVCGIQTIQTLLDHPERLKEVQREMAGDVAKDLVKRMSGLSDEKSFDGPGSTLVH